MMSMTNYQNMTPPSKTKAGYRLRYGPVCTVVYNELEPGFIYGTQHLFILQILHDFTYHSAKAGL